MRSFIDVIEADKLPAAFGRFKNEAYRCVFFVVWSLLKRTVDPIPLRGFFLRFSASKTLRSIGVAFEDFVITAQEVLLVLYDFHFIAHRQWELRHLRDRGFIASDNRRLKFLPECRKVALCKRAWK